MARNNFRGGGSKTDRFVQRRYEKLEAQKRDSVVGLLSRAERREMRAFDRVMKFTGDDTITCLAPKRHTAEDGYIMSYDMEGRDSNGDMCGMTYLYGQGGIRVVEQIPSPVEANLAEIERRIAALVSEYRLAVRMAHDSVLLTATQRQAETRAQNSLGQVADAAAQAGQSISDTAVASGMMVSRFSTSRHGLVDELLAYAHERVDENGNPIAEVVPKVEEVDPDTRQRKMETVGSVQVSVSRGSNKRVMDI